MLAEFTKGARISSKGTIHKLVIIMVRSYQSNFEMWRNEHHIMTLKQQVNHISSTILRFSDIIRSSEMFL